jgi:hypothetical protein
MKKLTRMARESRQELLRRTDNHDLPLSEDPYKHHWDTMVRALIILSLSQERASAKGNIEAGKRAASVFVRRWEG